MQLDRNRLGKLSENGVRYFALIICVCFASVAMIIDPGKMNLKNVNAEGVSAVIRLFFMECREVELSHLLAIAFVAYVFNRFLLKKEAKFDFTAAGISFILSCFLICGMSLSNFNNLSFLVGRKAQFLIAVIVFWGIFLILYTLLKFFYGILDQKKEKHERKIWNELDKKLEVRFVLKVFLLFVVVWLLQVLPYFPGSVPHDGRYQLNQFFAYSDMNLHHPYYVTMLMGTIYSIGSKLFGYMGGCIFYVMFQCILGALVFASVCKYIRYRTGRITLCVGSILFYALTPMWWTYIQTLDKSSIAFICITWFTLEYMKILLEEEVAISVYIHIMAAGVCSCLFRNDSKYVIIVAFVVLLVLKHKMWKRILLISVSAMLIVFGLNAFPTNYLGLKSMNQVEPLSIPLQQIARYVTYHGDELTEEEKKIIDQVVQYEGIADRYNPELSDPVKDHWRPTDEEEFEAFFSLWLEKLKERPKLYIVATMNNMYGYTDPFYFYTGLSRYALYNKESFGDYDAGVVYSNYIFSDEIRSTIFKITYGWCKIPFLSFFVNPGAYTWLGFVMLGAVLRRRKWDYALSFCIPVLLTLICFASPVNGLLRYSLPIMAITPLYVMLGVLPYVKKLEKSSGNTLQLSGQAMCKN